MVKTGKTHFEGMKKTPKANLENILDRNIPEETGVAEIGYQDKNQAICPVKCSDKGKFYKCYREDYLKCKEYKKRSKDGK